MVDARRDKVQSLILRILSDMGQPVYTTALVKLTYFIDYFYTRQTGESATDLQWIWDEYGPNTLGHEIVKEAGALEQARQIEIKSAPGGDKARVYQSLDSTRFTFDPILEAIIGEVLKNYGSLSVEELKQESKRTLPFQNARPGDRLILSQSERTIPPATEEDWNKHQQERLLGQGKTVGELRAKYKID